ncbi:MAG: hypothetical protein AAGA66_13190 [Bacteroidota bacterium]
MKNKFFYLITFIVFLSGCGNDNELNVNLNTSGGVILSFTDEGGVIADAEIRIKRLTSFTSIATNFQSNNSFEGTLDGNGAVAVGPLNEGIYYFRVDLGNKGFFIESFEIISGTSFTRTFDLEDYSSRVEFNLNGSTATSGGAFYLIPSFLDRNDDLDADEVRPNAILGQVDEGKIVFDKVVVGTYILTIQANDEFIKLSSFPLSVERDFDNTSLNISLPASLELQGKTWNIQQTTERFSSQRVTNVVSSVSFSAFEYTITFVDGSSHIGSYSASRLSDGSISLTLSSVFTQNPDARRIDDMDVSSSGVLSVEYVDSNANDFIAILN